MKGHGPVAQMMGQRFRAARRRYGLDRPLSDLDLSAFKVPPKPGDQVDLFG